MPKLSIKLEPYLRDVEKKRVLLQLIQTTNIAAINLYKDQNNNNKITAHQNWQNKIQTYPANIWLPICIISLNEIHPKRSHSFTLSDFSSYEAAHLVQPEIDQQQFNFQSLLFTNPI